MQHRTFVHAVELEAVDLVGVDDRGRLRQHLLAGQPDGRLVALAPAGGDFLEVFDADARGSGDADPQRIQKERLDLVDRFGRQVLETRVDHMVGDTVQRIGGRL